jgi:hypothetical protein
MNKISEMSSAEMGELKPYDGRTPESFAREKAWLDNNGRPQPEWSDDRISEWLERYRASMRSDFAENVA